MASVTIGDNTLHYAYAENWWNLRNWAQDKLDKWEQIELHVSLAAFGAPHWTVLKILLCAPADRVCNPEPPEMVDHFTTVFDVLRDCGPDKAEYYDRKAARDVYRVIPNGCDALTFSTYRPDILPEVKLDNVPNAYRLCWMLPAPGRDLYFIHPQFNRLLTDTERVAIYGRDLWEGPVLGYISRVCKSMTTEGDRVQVRYDHYTQGGVFKQTPPHGTNMRQFDYSQIWPRSWESSEPIDPEVPFPIIKRKGDKHARRAIE